ncbi:MAG: Bifunctional protein HldE [Microgenomates bacterium OLB22]|nr:MAG: Bifunctional protein HldE [Microgenomates bacterium OLB22]
MKITVGTTSDQKLGYLAEVLDEIGIKAQLLPTEVSSDVSDQPLTYEETERGSANRAEAALKHHPGADIAIGIEVGYHPSDNRDYEMFCIATIIHHDKSKWTCSSSRFLLPLYHQDILKQDKPLGEYVCHYMQDSVDPATAYIRELVRGRKPLIYEAVRNVLLQYLLKDPVSDSRPIIIFTSGYFDPLHIGHIELFERARALGDKLIVAVNNDTQTFMKKGMVFMPAEEKVRLIRAIKWVDEVVISIDKDSTQCETLRLIKPDVFAKGGDRYSYEIPESSVCQELGIKIIDGLGDKIQSSSQLIAKAKETDPVHNRLDR